jgi:hypothetical protein
MQILREKGSRPKVSRAEKQIRNLERGFLLGGVVLLALTMSFAGKFGWGLGSDDLGKFGSALFYVTADAIGALLMSSVGVLFAWRWYGWGAFATIAMLACIAFSMASIFGYQSSNRTAVTMNYEAVQKRADERLSWLRGQVVDKNLARERTTFLTEEKEQFRTMQTVTADPDAQASELATMLGVTKAEAQRKLNVAAAGFILFLQFVCLSLRSFFRHRAEPIIASFHAANTRQFPTDKPVNAVKTGAFTPEQARSHLDLLIAGGFHVDERGAATSLARRFGWTVNRTTRWLRAQADLAVPPPLKRAPRKAAEGQVIPINGNGRAHA